MQGFQVPFEGWNSGASSFGGLAFTTASGVVTIVGSEYTINGSTLGPDTAPTGILITGVPVLPTLIYTGPKGCVEIVVMTKLREPTQSPSYYLDMELSMDESVIEDTGVCGEGPTTKLPRDDSLFTGPQLDSLCE